MLADVCCRYYGKEYINNRRYCQEEAEHVLKALQIQAICPEIKVPLPSGKDTDHKSNDQRKSTGKEQSAEPSEK
jgi:hypothetical protein